MKIRHSLTAFTFLMVSVAVAQPGPPQKGPPAGGGNAPPQPRDGGPPPLGPLESGQRSRWWLNPETAQTLSLTADQQTKMDDIFQQHRLTLVDLNASLQKAEIGLEPLLAAEQPDEPKILAQIDRAAQARAELEKAHARMLLGLRRVLTQDQWTKLKADEVAGRGGRRPGRGGDDGPGQPPGPPPGPGRAGNPQ
jgi:Spy/CpxP family protein refolding chaperone